MVDKNYTQKIITGNSGLEETNIPKHIGVLAIADFADNQVYYNEGSLKPLNGGDSVTKPE